MIRRRILLPGLTMIAFLVFTACSTKTAPTMAPPETSLSAASQNPAPTIAVKETWEVEWGKTLALAKKEGTLMILVEGEASPIKAVNEGFEKRYSIPVTILSAGTGLVLGKLLSERRAGLYTTDILFGGGTTTITLKATGAFDPIEKIPVLPEVIDPKVWWRGSLEYIDKDRYIIAFLASPTVPWVINGDLVRPADEPKMWKDLLDPRWKGKIVMRDPRVDGAGSTNFTLVASDPELGLDFWKQFAKQEPMVIRDQRLQVEWLARGKYFLGTNPTAATVKQFTDTGAPLKWIMPKKGQVALSSASGNITLLNKAPHPNAAKVYINYLLTREAQTSYSRAGGYQSGRVDVPTDHMEPLKVRQTGMEYFFASSEDYALKVIENRKVAIEIFGQ